MRAVGRRILDRPVASVIEQIVSSRHEPARESVRALRHARPEASPAELADAIVARYRRELGGMGAASGAVAVVPGVGTGITVAGSVAESGWSMVRLGQMILEIGMVFGHDAERLEARRAWVLAVLTLALGSPGALELAAGLAGRRGGAHALYAMTPPQLGRVNRAMTARLMLRWGSAQAAIRLGNIVPFGVGAAIGVAGNVLLVNLVGARARGFFAGRDG